MDAATLRANAAPITLVAAASAALGALAMYAFTSEREQVANPHHRRTGSAGPPLRREASQPELDDGDEDYDDALSVVDETAPIKPRPGTSHKPLTLLRGGILYDPKPRGRKEVLVGGGQVLAILDEGTTLDGQEALVETVDCTSMFICPGFVDIHVHITGGGGELGPESRTPEARLSDLFGAGITTVVGVRGTDSISRSLENVLVKAKSLRRQGLNCHMYTGAYRTPVGTITGDIQKDIVCIEECVGVGEIAISDHRGQWAGTETLAEIVADARVAGLLSGKGGVFYAHMGVAKAQLGPLWAIVKTTTLPIENILPTHINRNADLLADGRVWCEAGGNVDFSVSRNLSTHLLTLLNGRDDPLASHVCVSSDAYGSIPDFDDKGNLISYRYLHPKEHLASFADLLSKGWTLEQILPLYTSNPARFLKLPTGTIQVGRDADILVLRDGAALELVMARGKVVAAGGWVQPDFCT